MTAADLERFRKLAGLLGSDQVGERAAAALKCTEWLASHGLAWADVSLPVVADPVPEPAELLKRRRETATDDLRKNAEPPMSDFEKAVRNHKAAKKAAWEQARYGADADGFETGRK